MIVAAQTGLPVVDGDGMGRAFPEVQMTTFFIHGAPTAPAALADDKGNEAVIGAVRDMYWLERLARRITVEMGATAGMAQAPMDGAFVKRTAVPDTVSLARDVGRTILSARREQRSVVAALGAPRRAPALQRQGHRGPARAARRLLGRARAPRGAGR
jgi:uncharacterized protein